MKTNVLRAWAAVGLSVLTATATYRASATDASTKSTAAKSTEAYRGTVVSVNPRENTLDVKGSLFSKKDFNLGNNCDYTIAGKGASSMDELRPGQKVTVHFQNAHGVLIADHVTQTPMQDEGMVKAIDPAKHTITVHAGWLNDRKFQLPANCDIVLRGGKSGTIADIQPGNHVTVTYEVPQGKPTAREIAQTSATFTGKLTAINLNKKTLEADATFSSKKFNVGDDCAIVINGKPDGKLTDLRPGENLTFSYNDINGVNIVNRIAPEGATKAGSVAEK